MVAQFPALQGHRCLPFALSMMEPNRAVAYCACSSDPTHQGPNAAAHTPIIDIPGVANSLHFYKV